jgi:outer membrane protein OmpA-like peptidoglycan-associated protein
VEGVQRLPSELGSAMRQAVAGMGRGADAETLRRLETAIAQIEAKQTKLEQAKKRQKDLADQFDAVARTAGFRVRTTEEGISIVLTNVLFEDSASDLTEDSRAQVCKVAETLASGSVTALLGPDYTIEIVGYSSPTGIITSRRKDDSNMLLSIDRAYAAYDWLTKNPDKAESRCGGGRCRDARSCAATVPQDRVQVTGRGYNDAQVGTDEVLRRVEIHVALPDLEDE